MNKRSLFRALGLTVVLWGAGVIAVNTQGVASCLPQVGLSALLQKALFAPTPSCALNNLGKCASPGAACTINTALSPGHGTPGICTATTVGCACVAHP